MWSDLAYLVERQCREGRARTGDARAASLAALYGSIVNCQIAFERLERDHTLGHDETGDAHTDAALAMDVVLATLHNVQPVLRLFAPERAHILARYVRGHHRPAAPEASRAQAPPTRDLKQQVEIMRHLLALETAEDLRVPSLAAFSEARRRMAAAIREACSAEELFGA